MTTHQDSFLDRVLRIPSMRAANLGGDFEVAVGLPEPLARFVVLGLLGVGVHRIILLSEDLAAADETAAFAEVHAPWAHIELQHPSTWRPRPKQPSDRLPGRVTLLDGGSSLYSRLASGSAGRAFVVARTEAAIEFGTDESIVERAVGPLEPRAELWALAGELLTAVCAARRAWIHPKWGFGLASWPERASIPTPALPDPADLPTRPLRLLLAGGGGAIATQFLIAALGFDPVLRHVFGPDQPDSLIRIVDNGVVEESNRARQLLYDRALVPKAPEMVGRVQQLLLPGARVEAAQGDLCEAHFDGGFDVAFSSLDSWGADGRWLLGHLCDRADVPWIVQTGSDPLGGMQRLVHRDFSPCMNHGPERLSERDLEHRSCGEGGDDVLPSLVVPQCIVGGTAAVNLRDHFVLGRPVDPRGVDVKLTCRGDDGLLFGPGDVSIGPCGCASHLGDPSEAA